MTDEDTGERRYVPFDDVHVNHTDDLMAWTARVFAAGVVVGAGIAVAAMMGASI